VEQPAVPGRTGPEDRPTVLLTGGSGVLGVALRQRLAGHRVHCLTHRAELVAPPGGRLRTVRGDVRQPRFGLGDREYAALVTEVDAVVHAAAVTDFGVADGRLEATNVGGVRTVLDFAAAAGARLHHVSTAFIDSASRSGLTKAGLRYAESKRAGEELVRGSGVPYVLTRPSIVIGDSRTGEAARFQGLFRVAGAIADRLVPVVPFAADWRCDFLPRDLVADLVVGLLERGRPGEELWLTAGGRALTVAQILEEFVGAARAAGRDPIRPRCLSADVYQRLIAPVFLPALPPRQRRLVEGMFDNFAPYIGSSEPLPTSLPELAGRGLPEPPDLTEALRASLDYWSATVLGRPARASGGVA